MVQLMRSGRNLRPDPEAATIRDKFPVKLEIEDSLEEEHGPLNKRSKSSTPFNEWSTGNNEFPIPPSQYNPLDEPSPLGLRLRKSPSLLDLIQMRLSQGNASSVASAPTGSLNLRDKKDVKDTITSAATDKLKASNFPALLLKIGHWEYVSRFEGDLVAKCYFAKHKLVWEILEGGLKSKLEIQWSDIMALKANCPDDGPGTLTVTLARPPLFFKETNPQPRKHTLWQATADFTDGQASIHRQHYLQCTQGLLNKHYEKLIQCDMRLNLVSRQPDMVLDSPYFEARCSVFKDPNKSKVQEVDHLETAKRPPISSFQDMASLSTAQSSSLNDEEQNSVVITSEHLSPEASSPSSVEGNTSHGGDGCHGQQDWEQLKGSCLHPSMSMSDLVNHIGHRISERMASGNSRCSEGASECQDMLENIAHILLSDTQFTTASDEKKLMSRVNSLCCLLQDQDPATAPNLQVDRESHHPSMSMSDLVNHIGHRISEQMASGNSRCSGEASECQDMLESIARVLLSDTQFATASDEKKLMSRVNSLCCLLQDPVPAPNVQADSESHLEGLDDGKHIQGNHPSEAMHENKSGSDFRVLGESSNDVPSCKQAPAMSRKDSFGDLLLNLPRIASLPKFLFDISEDDENQSR